MSWLFRLLDHVLGRFRAAEANSEDPKWVEPSNAITRAILSGAVGQLLVSEPVASAVAVPPASAPIAPAPAVAVEVPATPAEADEVAARPAAAIVTRTAQRARRRRATRAA